MINWFTLFKTTLIYFWMNLIRNFGFLFELEMDTENLWFDCGWQHVYLFLGWMAPLPWISWTIWSDSQHSKCVLLSISSFRPETSNINKNFACNKHSQKKVQKHLKNYEAKKLKTNHSFCQNRFSIAPINQWLVPNQLQTDLAAHW